MIETVTHRGSYATIENSLSAIQEAIDKGFRFIEFDVRQTKDGVPIVMHDSSVNRTSNGKGRVRKMTFEQLRAVRLKSGEQIPSLQEVIDLCKGKIDMWMHVKMFSGDIEHRVWEIVKRNNIEHQIVLSSLSLRHLKYFRMQSEKVRINVLSFLPYFRTSHAKAIKAFSIQPRFRITTSFVQHMKKHRIKVLTWPINTKSQLRHYLKKGVDMIMTGEEELLRHLKEIKEKGSHLFK